MSSARAPASARPIWTARRSGGRTARRWRRLRALPAAGPSTSRSTARRARRSSPRSGSPPRTARSRGPARSRRSGPRRARRASRSSVVVLARAAQRAALDVDADDLRRRHFAFRAVISSPSPSRAPNRRMSPRGYRAQPGARAGSGSARRVSSPAGRRPAAPVDSGRRSKSASSAAPRPACTPWSPGSRGARRSPAAASATAQLCEPVHGPQQQAGPRGHVIDHERASPPGRSTRSTSAIAAGVSGEWCSTPYEYTRSKLASAKGRCSASATSSGTSRALRVDRERSPRRGCPGSGRRRWRGRRCAATARSRCRRRHRSPARRGRERR
jgi:hypothetical protein